MTKNVFFSTLILLAFSACGDDNPNQTGTDPIITNNGNGNNGNDPQNSGTDAFSQQSASTRLSVCSSLIEDDGFIECEFEAFDFMLPSDCAAQNYEPCVTTADVRTCLRSFCQTELDPVCGEVLDGVCPVIDEPNNGEPNNGNPNNNPDAECSHDDVGDLSPGAYGHVVGNANGCGFKSELLEFGCLYDETGNGTCETTCYFDGTNEHCPDGTTCVESNKPNGNGGNYYLCQ